jgi:cellulose synthase/poly-beta-1,6-N-acetylglucosamine synthase-like glycosyltransferase
VTLVVLAAVVAFFALWYLTFIAVLRRGLGRLPRAGRAAGLSYSVIIAARNEEENISECLRSVLTQTLDSVRYEVIVVDDRSTDGTAAIVEGLAARFPNLRLVQVHEVPAGISPKKNALLVGMQGASQPVVACTDADCRVPPTWLETLDRFFGDRTGFVQGITSYRRPEGMNRAFFALQAVDFLSHGIVAAAAIGAGMPLNSNGNNLAYRRAAFRAVGGYGETSSVALGDDDLLLQRIARHPDWDVAYMADPAGAVQTRPTPTLGGVLEQRRRWGSVTAHYGGGQITALAGVFLFYCSIVAALVGGFFDPRVFAVLGAAALIKLAGELVLMLPGSRRFGQTGLRPAIVPMSLLHLPMVLVSVLGGIFGGFDWKGQRMSHELKR